MSKPKLTVRDLVVVRQYVHKGISVLVEIDRIKKKVSLVEVDNSGSRRFKVKKWAFGDRSLEYMNGWVAILEAMTEAVKAAQKELEDMKDAEFKAIVDAMVNRKSIKNME